MTKEQFKQIRLSLGLTQISIARLLGRHERTVQRWEVGDWPICKDIAERVLKLEKGVKHEEKNRS